MFIFVLHETTSLFFECIIEIHLQLKICPKYFIVCDMLRKIKKSSKFISIRDYPIMMENQYSISIPLVHKILCIFIFYFFLLFLFLFLAFSFNDYRRRRRWRRRRLSPFRFPVARHCQLSLWPRPTPINCTNGKSTVRSSQPKMIDVL